LFFKKRKKREQVVKLAQGEKVQEPVKKKAQIAPQKKKGHPREREGSESEIGIKPDIKKGRPSNLGGSGIGHK